MADTPSVKITKTILFNNVAREWSNRYHFNGGTPADDAHWHTLFDAITAAEKLVISANCSIVRAQGYAAGSDIPVSTKTYSLAGTGSFGSFPTPTQTAALVRYATAVRTDKNHPVYLFNYYHDAYVQGNGSVRDALVASQASALATYAAAWISGFSDGSTSYNRAGPRGASATGSLVEPWVTHRDLRK